LLLLAESAETDGTNFVAPKLSDKNWLLSCRIYKEVCFLRVVIESDLF